MGYPWSTIPGFGLPSLACHRTSLTAHPPNREVIRMNRESGITSRALTAHPPNRPPTSADTLKLDLWVCASVPVRLNVSARVTNQPSTLVHQRLEGETRERRRAKPPRRMSGMRVCVPSAACTALECTRPPQSRPQPARRLSAPVRPKADRTHTVPFQPGRLAVAKCTRPSQSRSHALRPVPACKAGRRLLRSHDAFPFQPARLAVAYYDLMTPSRSSLQGWLSPSFCTPSDSCLRPVTACTTPCVVAVPVGPETRASMGLGDIRILHRGVHCTTSHTASRVSFARRSTVERVE